jgi:hypothetical protein
MSDLFEYGIQNEESDIRAHVSVTNKSIYVFQTMRGIEAIKKHSPPIRTATQPGANGKPTAEGWLVDIDWIIDLRCLNFKTWRWDKFSEALSTSEKGKIAVECVIEILKMGRFPLWINAKDEDRRDIQIKGTDILLFCHQRIQAKCDWRAGKKPLGTGNLFLQKAERNPFGMR